MKRLRRAKTLIALISLIVHVLGCSSSDERLVELSERASQRQQQQNELVARQSDSVSQSSRNMTEAAKQLVEQDAQARRELIEVQQKLQGQLNAERSNLDQQRTELEAERKQIATQRQRDPVIAGAIEVVGVWLLGLLPLFVALYALAKLDDGRQQDELNGLLIEELASDRPPLRPPAPGSAGLLTAPIPESPEPREEEPSPIEPPPF